VLIELISLADRANIHPKTTMQLTTALKQRSDSAKPRSQHDDHPPEPDHHAPPRTPRREGAPEPRGRSAAFIGKKAEIDEMLARLQALSDDHFNAHPDEVNWADVGTLEHYASLLKRITDSAFGEGEHAADLRPSRNARRAEARLGVVEGAACRGPEYGDPR
jgi:hypothetical protein